MSAGVESKNDEKNTRDDNCDLETNKALVNEVIPVREKAKARHGDCTLTNHDNEYNHSVTRILHYFRNA
jgi:hypothetical protein